MITTNVTLLYPYQWQFNRIITVMLADRYLSGHHADCCRIRDGKPELKECA